jgi:hypothetical protein
MHINDSRIGLWAGFRRNPARNIAMLRPLVLVGCLLAAPALAETAVLTIAQDRYEAGEAVRFDGPAVSDLFLAGNRVVVASPVGGSAHLVGRRVTVEGPVTGDLFAMGYRVEIGGVVGGDASVSGYEIRLGPIAGNLRAAGSEVEVGTVGGYALVTGADVALQGAIAGDAVLVADDLEFGPGASVAGTLTIYAEDPATITVPESVAPAARVKIETRRSYDKGGRAAAMPYSARRPVEAVMI